MKILVTIPEGTVRDTFIPCDVVEQLEALGEIVWNKTGRQYSAEELRELLSNVDVCITGWGTVRFDETVLEKADSLKLVAHTGGTVAPIVSDVLFEKGIRIISGNDIFAESVAEGVIAYALASLREIPYYNKIMLEQGWRGEQWFNEGLLDKTVGLVSFGAVARHTVKMLKPFHTKIKVYPWNVSDQVLKEYGVEKASLEEIFSTCKVISIHTAATPESYHMIDRELIRKIPDGSLLINTARGSVIDEEALTDELMTGRFKAVLDVYEEEPLPFDSRLRELSNVLLIPHMAGPTIDRRKMVTMGLIDDIKNLYNGCPLKLEISRDIALYMTK